MSTIWVQGTAKSCLTGSKCIFNRITAREIRVKLSEGLNDSDKSKKWQSMVEENAGEATTFWFIEETTRKAALWIELQYRFSNRWFPTYQAQVLGIGQSIC